MTFHRNRPDPTDPTFPDDDVIAAGNPYCLPEDWPFVSLIADAEATLYWNGTPSIRRVQCISLVAGPFEFPAEHSSGYNLEAPSLASGSTTQWTGINLNSLPGSAGEGHVQLQTQAQGGDTSLASTSANTSHVPDPWTQLQRTFLKFLVKNRHILQSLPDSTPCSIAQVKQAFEQNMHQNSLVFHSADLDKIIQQFKPQISTTAIRRECDLKKKDATSTGKFVCPFRFCDGHFTRGAGLQNHLGAHFKLKPCRCSRCRKYYSDTAFDRHVHGCKA
ncbi:hypothetical protein BDN70DRAFT_108566 [Pholiota conissans]|uniref:C2H2-type domain-containing protein n=1 Tax=Pholiota conissans TaxID=109636 RepID=A0A9P6CSM7_9AGAR|nr:hypothetical protein BDN70DRAFT_108566 [Pholiota conissans]